MQPTFSITSLVKVEIAGKDGIIKFHKFLHDNEIYSTFSSGSPYVYEGLFLPYFEPAIRNFLNSEDILEI